MEKDLEGLLSKDDHIVEKTRQHWFVFVRSAWQFALLAIVLFTLLWLVGQPSWLDNRLGKWLAYFLIASVALDLMAIAWRFVSWRFESLYLTNTQVVYASGVFNRSVLSTPYVKIDEITLIRPFLGRILGFGRLEVANAAGGKEPLAGLEFIPDPSMMYQTITERARHQRMLEGGGRNDKNEDGFVDEIKEAETSSPIDSDSPIDTPTS